jgi:SAM-dependent methyltransferase
MLAGVDEGRPRSLVFGEVADLYDRRRPSYPPELVDTVVASAPPGSALVDVGCGTGQATSLFAVRGVAVVGVEASPAMAAQARTRCRPFPRVTVVTSRFEDWDGPRAGFGAVTAAQSWHWVDQDLGLAKAAHVLCPEGVLALFWNTPRPEGTPLAGELQEAYRRQAPDLADSSVVFRWHAGADEQEERLVRSGWFGPCERRSWDWASTYTTEEYVELLQTHSDHRLLPGDQRRRLLDDVAAVVDRAGGRLTYAYRTLLVMSARRPSGA